MSLIKLINHKTHSEIWIYRADSLNSLNPDVLNGLINTFQNVSNQTKVIFLRTEGNKSFVAGADIKAMQQMNSEQLIEFAKLAHNLLNIISNAKYIVVACVQGFAFGGGMELALGCDLILASNKAKFSLPELNLGLIPGFGGTQRLIQRCGIGFTKRAILTSEQISADLAINIGLVDYLVDENNLEQEIARLAQIFAAKSLTSIEAAKKSINKFYCDNLQKGIEYELSQFANCFNSPDGKEGLKAFIEKRTPEFK